MSTPSNKKEESDPEKGLLSSSFSKMSTSTLATTPCSTNTIRTQMEDDQSSSLRLTSSERQQTLDDESSDGALLSSMSLHQKLQLLSGASLWNLAEVPSLPQITVSDGPHGVRKPLTELNLHQAHPATCFPTAAALACSWDPSLLQSVGQALAKECLHYNIQILLGPGMNLKRHPAGGRNFEYFAEDPYLTGRLAAAYVEGVQHDGRVGATVKHFAVNNQESHRFVVNAVVDERTARELYLRHFEHVVTTTKPAAVMCAYNKVNGVFCSEHTGLNTTILRREWNYDGIVMTDWGATNNRSTGIRAGIDLEMPGSHGAHEDAIRADLRGGNLSTTDDVDAACLRMLQLMKTYAPSVAESDQAAADSNPVDWKAHYDLAYRVAMECVVLLRNEGNILPLKPQTSVALIGDFAREHPRYQGMGSSQVSSQKVVTVFDELLRFTKEIHFAAGYHADDDHPENVDQELLDEAVEVAKKAQVAILCLGLPEIMESEGFDREHLQLPAQHQALIESVSQANPKVIVVLSNGGAVELPWFQKAPAILEGYLLGEAGGAAMVDLIFGQQSPCGKLSETFPLQMDDIPASKNFPGTQAKVEYREGLNVGYRYFDTAQKPVQYPFGHGLSYTTFEYNNLSLQVHLDNENEVLVEVQFELTNTGSCRAKEISQCYIHVKESTVYRPVHELRHFCKSDLLPGERRTIKFQLDKSAFSFFDVGLHDWIIENGEFAIEIGSSSRDIRLRGDVCLTRCVNEASADARNSYPAVADTGIVCPMGDEHFAKRFFNSTLFSWPCQGDDEDENAVRVDCHKVIFHRNSLLKEIANKRILGWILMSVVYQAASSDIAKGPRRRRQKRMVRAAVENLPLRTIVLFSKGGLSFDLLDGLISAMNWYPIATLVNFAKAFARLFRRRGG